MERDTSGFEPNVCPIGITNGKNLEILEDHVDMAIKQLADSVGDIKKDISTLSNNISVQLAQLNTMNNKFTVMDSRFKTVEDNLSDVKSDLKGVDHKFATIDTKLSGMDTKIDLLEKNLTDKITKIDNDIPNRIEEEINKKKGNAASSAIKWIFCGVGASILISVLTAWVKSKLGL